MLRVITTIVCCLLLIGCSKRNGATAVPQPQATQFGFYIAVRAQDANPSVERQAFKDGQGTTAATTTWLQIHDIKYFLDHPRAPSPQAAAPQIEAYMEDTFQLIVAHRDGAYYVLVRDAPPNQAEWRVTEVSKTVDQLGRPAVHFLLDEASTAQLRTFSAAHINEPIAITFDSEVYSIPTINSAFGEGFIAGNFSAADVEALMDRLTSSED